jgi:ankyrin repeat protein
LLELLRVTAVKEETMQDQLFAAAESGNRDEVQRLVAAGVDVNAKGRDGLTALMKACLKGHLEVARVL